MKLFITLFYLRIKDKVFNIDEINVDETEFF